MRAAGWVDTRPLLRPLLDEFMTLLRGLSPEDWTRPTPVAGWAVRDVAAHVLDGWLRRLACQRDGLTLPPPARPIEGFADLVGFIDGLNAEWVRVARGRLGPRLLIDLIATVAPQWAEFLEGLDPHAPAFWAVGWAGDAVSPNWFDVGRDFTEVWHHQQQIREAVNAPPLTQPRFLGPVLALGLRALPRAYAAVAGAHGDCVAVRVVGPAGGEWALVRGDDARWGLFEGTPSSPRARLALDEDAAWRLLFKALPHDEARRRIACEGDPALTQPIFDALALMA
jgi:uncharacterized protein (TIGR03083 family)